MAMIPRGRARGPDAPAPHRGNSSEDHLMANKWLLVAPVASALGVGAGIGANELFAANDAKQDLKPSVSLPLTRVVLFNSGVGYFSRSGEVEGEARVDLTFPE